MKKILILILTLSALLQAKAITIAVAANVSYAINDLKKEFSKTYPNINIKVILGSSGKLTAQIKRGAPYELFMSANMKYPNALFEDKIAITKPIVYAKGSLAILSNKKRDFSSLEKLLQSKGIKKIAIANPKSAPYGKAAMEALKNANILNNIQNKFVYAESVSQTVAYTVSAADIGLIAKSSLYSSKMKRFKKDINWKSINTKLYTPINQGIVLLKGSSKEAKYFYDFILSDKAKKIFKRYGYLVP